MAINSYFRPHEQVMEQELVDSLVTEALRIYGYEFQYIPRITNTIDSIFNETTSSKYEGAYPVPMYIRNIDGFSGDGQFLQKFGIEIRSQITLTVSIREFVDEVGQLISRVRPLEGDLLYFAMDNKLFEIKKVDKYSVFYQTGSLQTYDLVCEVFEYGGEHLNTGIAEVDAIENALSFSSESGDHALVDSDGFFLIASDRSVILTSEIDEDPDGHGQISSSDEFGAAADDMIDLTEDDPLSETF